MGRRDRTSAVNEMQESVARAGWAGDLTPALLRKANSQKRRAAISRFFEKRKVETRGFFDDNLFEGREHSSLYNKPRGTPSRHTTWYQGS